MLDSRLLLAILMVGGGSATACRASSQHAAPHVATISSEPSPSRPSPSAATTTEANVPTPSAYSSGASTELEGPLDALEDNAALRDAAEAWLEERRRAAPADRVTNVTVHRFAETTDAAAIQLVFSPADSEGLTRRVFGLVSTRLDGSQTLEMPSEPCGELNDTLVDLHGDGARFAVFTEVGGGYHCQLASVSVGFELAGGRWLEATSPDYPTDSTLLNADTIPDFSTSLFIFDLGECNYAACGDYFFRADVQGYESWDGKSFTRAGRYKAFYESRYQELAEQAKSLADAGACDLERLTSGVQAFSYAILSGRRRPEALSLARRFFHGVRPDQCTENGAMRSLHDIEQQLVKAQPVLEADR